MTAELNFDDCVPPIIRDEARKLFRRQTFFGKTGHKELIARLISDPRMRKVWKELNKTRYVDREHSDQPYYEAIPIEGEDFTSNKARHTYALGLLFQQMVFLTMFGMDHLRTAEPHEQAQDWIKTAQVLDCDADLFDGLRLFKHAKDLRRAAHSYRSIAWNPIIPPGFSLFFKEEKNWEARNLAYLLSRFLTSRFVVPIPDSRASRDSGSFEPVAGMYGMVAKIVSVALSTDVTASAVREWMKSRWAHKISNAEDHRPEQ